MQIGDIAIENCGVLTYVGLVKKLHEYESGGAWGTATAYITKTGEFYGVSTDHWFRPSSTFFPPVAPTPYKIGTPTVAEEIPF